MTHDAIDSQLKRRGVVDRRVLGAFAAIPRVHFVPESLQAQADDDCALPIGDGQSISQPCVVALMTQRAQVRPETRVLEIGTGSGYQTAILAHLSRRVFSIERIPWLQEQAAARLQTFGLSHRVTLRTGDGTHGWPEVGPFDAIVVTAAPRRVPEALCQQLSIGGRLIIPVGPPERQQLMEVLRVDEQTFHYDRFMDVRFVPLVAA